MELLPSLPFLRNSGTARILHRPSHACSAVAHVRRTNLDNSEISIAKPSGFLVSLEQQMELSLTRLKNFEGSIVHDLQDSYPGIDDQWIAGYQRDAWNSRKDRLAIGMREHPA